MTKDSRIDKIIFFKILGLFLALVSGMAFQINTIKSIAFGGVFLILAIYYIFKRLD